MYKIVLVFIISFVFCFRLESQERKIFSNILLFGEHKKPLAYIDKDYSLFNWESGEKIAWLAYNPKTELYDVINDNNIVLGYWRDGIIFNPYKKVALSEENALEKYMMQLNADKGIKSVLLDLEIQGWISLKEFEKTEKP